VPLIPIVAAGFDQEEREVVLKAFAKPIAPLSELGLHHPEKLLNHIGPSEADVDDVAQVVPKTEM